MEFRAYVNPLDIRKGLAPEQATRLGFLPVWRETFEKLVWGMIDHTPHGPVPHCRIFP
jgi:hypothetical protein